MSISLFMERHMTNNFNSRKDIQRMAKEKYFKFFFILFQSEFQGKKDSPIKLLGSQP